jgi:hypothetical protein
MYEKGQESPSFDTVIRLSDAYEETIKFASECGINTGYFLTSVNEYHSNRDKWSLGMLVMMSSARALTQSPRYNYMTNDNQVLISRSSYCR